MKGHPKFDYEDKVKFTLGDGKAREGVIYIIDKWGTFENPEDVSYDIMVESENCLYKHISEKLVTQVD